MAEQDLSHVDAIIEDLAGLASKQRGAPLRADDWNVVVDAVRELALIARGRAITTADALAANYAPLEHEHLAVVGLDWLDGPTRALVEGKGAGDFTVRDDIKRLDKGVSGLRTDLGNLSSEVTSLRELVLQLRDEVIGGNRKFGKLELRVEALKDLERGVERIGSDFSKLDGRLGEVLELRDKIGDGEGQIDLAGLGKRVDELEQMRSKLIGNSAPPDLRALQQDLIKLADRFDEVGPGKAVDLSDASKAQLEQLLDAELASTKIRLDALDAKTLSQAEALSQQADTLGKLGDFELASTKVGELESQLGDLAGKYGQLEGQSSKLETQLGAVAGKLDGFDAGLDQRIDNKLAGIELGGSVDAEALVGIGSRLDQLETGVGKLDEQFGSLGDLDARFAAKASLDQFGASLGAHASRLDVLDQSFADAGAGLDDLGSRLGKVEGSTSTLGAWRGTVDNKLDSLAQGSNAEALALRVGDLEAAQLATNTWRTGTLGRLDALEVGASEAKEAREGLAGQLASQVLAQTTLGDQLGGLAANVEGLASWRGGVDGQLETLASTLGEQADLGGRVSAIEGMQLGKLDGRVASVEGSLSTLSTTLSEAKKSLDDQGARLSTAEGSLSGLSKDMAKTSTSVKSLSDTLAATTKTLDTFDTWRLLVDTKLGTLDGKQASLSDWKAGIDTKLITVDQTLGSLAGVNTRLNTLEASSKSLASWQKQTDTALGDLQVGVSKANELGARLDKVDNQMLSLTDSNAKLLAAAKLQPIAVQPLRNTTTRPLGG